MTPHQTAVNHRVVTAEAERLEAAGYQGNAHQFVEQLLLRAITDGYRPLEKPPPHRGLGASRKSIEEAIHAAEAAVRASKEKGGRR